MKHEVTWSIAISLGRNFSGLGRYCRFSLSTFVHLKVAQLVSSPGWKNALLKSKVWLLFTKNTPQKHNLNISVASLL